MTLQDTKDTKAPLRQVVAADTLPDALLVRSAEQPDELAYVFLTDGERPGDALTYRQLDQAARARADALNAVAHGGTAILMYPAGLEFIRSLLGCMYAKVAGAPVPVPTRDRGLERVRKIADDAGTTVVLTVQEVRDDLLARFGGSPLLDGLDLVATDTMPDAPPAGWQPPHVASTDIALLQYTSGSTGDPKGVMVTHGNFSANVRETDGLWPCDPDGVLVSWLPHFHDMGMLFGVVMPLWAGVPSYLMAPAAFIRRPSRWLEAISRFGGTHSAAPNFAYDLCVREAEQKGFSEGLDLSTWRVAANGAEPVRWSVIEEFTRTFASAGFRSRAMCPGYGLAENTLKSTASPQESDPTVLWVADEALREDRVSLLPGPGQEAQPLVGTGGPHGDTRVRIVDPETRVGLPSGRVGEIWISGPCVAAGYWGRPRESAETFRAEIAGEADAGAFLRTGDLGFQHEGELFVTGRIKDVIIRKGRNFYPQDIELSAERSCAGLYPNSVAAFSVDDGTTERLVVVVEADGRVLRTVGAELLRERVVLAVYDRQRLHVDDVVVVRRGSLPKTSSGKVQRRACRTLYLDGVLAPAGGRDTA
ncbi:fatty acyl-AMP ligase [Streptomyces johnsoniae]|uniref:Fatty acyl-AMP ligase n=1 Tax=Streptomyces johnsoniae TaxID=3075532 RepID=A0ABU2S199_9ACTN|nr:fatty acyl-AMP ligase [Streptomyces sp. DSM 41886]MDT0442563.1 fatty acyl-AMP ligase [Streptomyces sp. DSM 41886]